jgi:cell division protein FtsQ
VTAPSRPRRPPPGVVPAGPRLEARARAERAGRRRRWGRLVLRALLVLVPVVLLGWLFLASSLLAVDRFQVTGAERLTPEQVVEAAAVELGTPLARVGNGQARARVRQLPPVDDVRVRRVWPTTLRIDVTERVPVAGVAGRDGAALLDRQGVSFATEPALPTGLPRLQVAAPGPDDPTTRAALAVLLDLPPELARQVGVLRASTPSDVAFELRDGRTVVWGAAGDTDTKAPAVLALLRMPGELYDVSAPGVAVRR